ncbi:hypothetical protein C8Q76DRAFT_790758 [Earliella scabrosa]|nr:hypothetical protein C8Q76DRAFT_790758 [Earliella scabrosa]
MLRSLSFNKPPRAHYRLSSTTTRSRCASSRPSPYLHDPLALHLNSTLSRPVPPTTSPHDYNTSEESDGLDELVAQTNSNLEPSTEEAHSSKTTGDSRGPREDREDDYHGGPIVLYAQWAGVADPRGHPYAPDEMIHVYRSAVQPPLPLRTGLHVKVAAMSPISYHSPLIPPTRYEAYDPHVVGPIVGTMRVEGLVVVVVKNKCRRNKVRYAHIVVRHVRGRTVDKAEWETAPRAEASKVVGPTDRWEPDLEFEIIPLPSSACAETWCRRPDYGDPSKLPIPRFYIRADPDEETNRIGPRIRRKDR